MLRWFWRLLGWRYMDVTLRKMVYSQKTGQLEPSKIRIRYWTDINDPDADGDFSERVETFKKEGWEQ